MTEITDFLSHTPAAKHWEHIGIRKHHGIVIPLFALHSEKSCGIGEYLDLIPLMAWCKNCGMDVIQLLPLNDTGHSPSPYGSLSALALNPIHLGLSALPRVSENEFLSSLLKEVQKLNQELRTPYEQLHILREHFLREYYRHYSDNFLNSEEYLSFKVANTWVENYALFKAIKVCRHWESWTQWPENMRDPSIQSLEQLKLQFESDIAFHSLIQFFCFQQLKQVKLKADEHAIFLMGDLPILLDRESCDVWLNRSLFDLTLAAGAPPDAYSKIGQNWGFPIYNWSEMEKTDYKWCKQRLQVASNFYHIYRIDHVVGLYRIWSIPPLKSAKEGFFVPKNPADWIPQGEKILRMMLAASPMLPIGEDLGTVPPEVKTSLSSLGICGTRVMRWEREWHEEGHPYISILEYQPLGITTISTHDSETLHQWWEDFQVDARLFAESHGWDYIIPLSTGKRTAILKDSHHTTTLFHINLLQEYLARFPELIAKDPQMERINIPGTISSNNWSYRFKPTVEDIISNKLLEQYISGLIR